MDNRPSKINRRTLLTLLVSAPVTSAFVALPTISAAPASQPIRPKHRRVVLDRETLESVDSKQHARDLKSSGMTSGSDQVLGSPVIETDPFSLLAFTWPASFPATGLRLLARTRRNAAWGDWFELRDDGHHPDPRTREARSARAGTDPMIVGRSNAVEVRIETHSRAKVPDFRAELIDVESADFDSHAGSASGAVAHAASSPTKPQIYSRADWGADESIRDQDEPAYGEILGAFVHHTAGGNDYSADSVPSIIRGIYSYHVVGRKWRDIGYNFLIDKFGRIWEGRYGGIEAAVVGAHTANYNSYSFGAAVLGDYTAKEPEQAVMNAYRDLIAWKFTSNVVRPTSDIAYPGQLTLPAISGHRDTSATECPGQRLHNRLGEIRSRVDAAMLRFGDLSLEAPRRARAGDTIPLSVDWSVDTEPISGVVDLQSDASGRWRTIGQITVSDGHGSVNWRITRPQSYRLRARSTSSHDDVELSHPAGTSNEQHVTTYRGSPRLPDGYMPIEPRPISGPFM